MFIFVCFIVSTQITVPIEGTAMTGLPGRRKKFIPYLDQPDPDPAK
jgi:hypothetical protein